MEIYPLRPSFLEVIPEPLLAGVLGGVCFLFVAIILSLVTACYMSHRRRRRCRKRRQGKTPDLCKIHNTTVLLLDILIPLLLFLRSPICLPEELISRVSVLTSTPVHLHFSVPSFAF